jgi:ABC-type uncharacterized transport system involved in gliding motility auxiliary subunit
VLNIVALPLVITIIGLLYGWRRTRRNRRERA